MKNFLIQCKSQEENRKFVGNVLLIEKKLVELEDDAKCASLPEAHRISEKIYKPN